MDDNIIQYILYKNRMSYRLHLMRYCIQNADISVEMNQCSVIKQKPESVESVNFIEGGLIITEFGDGFLCGVSGGESIGGGVGAECGECSVGKNIVGMVQG